MSDHLRVDLGLLAELTKSLGQLGDEFANAGSIVDENHDAVGASDLTHALGSFAGTGSGTVRAC